MNFKIILNLIFVVGIAFQLQAQSISTKNIFWVHGLGGDETAWTKASEATALGMGSDFPRRDIDPVQKLTYNAISLNSAAFELDNEMFGSQASEGIENSFVIAHSQGGIVARQLDKLYEEGYSNRKFTGMVTFGSSHGGAQILNNKDLLEDALNSACDLSAGPVAEKTKGFFDERPLIDFFVNETEISNLFSGQICDGLVAAVRKFFFDAYEEPISEEYKVGASGINQLNAFHSPTPIMQFYGTERDDSNGPVIWKTMEYMINSNPNHHPYFTADDEPLVDDMNDKLLEYQAKYEYYNDRMDLMQDYSLGLVPCNWYEWRLSAFLCGLFNDEYWDSKEVRDAYKKGVDWWNSINTKYKVAIGATVIEVDRYSCCAAYLSGNPCYYTTTNPSNCYMNNLTAQVFSTTVVDKPSDGVVLKESAAKYLPNQTHPPVELEHSSHMQMRNDSNTKWALFNLYEGDYGYEFKVERK